MCGQGRTRGKPRRIRTHISSRIPLAGLDAFLQASTLEVWVTRRELVCPLRRVRPQTSASERPRFGVNLIIIPDSPSGRAPEPVKRGLIGPPSPTSNDSPVSPEHKESEAHRFELQCPHARPTTTTTTAIDLRLLRPLRLRDRSGRRAREPDARPSSIDDAAAPSSAVSRRA